MVKKALIISLIALTLLGCNFVQEFTYKIEPYIASLLAESEKASSESEEDTLLIEEPVTALITFLYNMNQNDSLINEGDGYFPIRCAVVDVKNFKAEVTFTDLPLLNSNQNSFGMLIRSTPDKGQIVAVAAGEWFVGNVTEDAIVEQEWDYHDLEVNGPQENHLEVYAVDEKGYVYVNNKLLTTLDLSSELQSGDICVLASFYSDDKAGITSTYQDFKVWFLEPR